MLSYCLKWRKKYTRCKEKNGRIMLLSKYAVHDSKKSEFIKEQETSALLSSLGMKKRSSKIPLVGPLLF